MKLAKAYEPQQYEANIYQLWETAAAFTPSKEGKGTYSIVMPPPNANGNLHMGHALTVAVEDVLVRYNRMLGKSTLFLPGADHAGFETWVVYERNLEKEGKSRFDFSREELYRGVWDFVHQNRGNMEIQLRQLGASVDWDTLLFTLDEKVIKTAYKTFKKLWDDGLVYRGKRLVNYCTKHHTAFADIEVSYDDQPSTLYYLKYGPFQVATTRPETVFGDVAVAVHPDDMRYKEYVGQELEVQGVNGPFKVKVIADELVDPSFGTGVVKVTPAHDFNDWEMGERHNLPAISVITLDGKLNEHAGKYAGMPILEARKAVVADMTEKGILLRTENYKHRVGVCYKCGTVIEPTLMDQWFLNVRPLAERARKVVAEGQISFSPASRAKALLNYYDGLRDWNLSRQIPWGIPIPAFQNVDDPDDWIFDERVEQETITVDGKTYKRDEDTFDTWFSSGQWPFITTDYLEGGELAKFYPVDVLETGFDILYPWVSRMIMLGLYRTDQIPFKHVYLHGMVLDEHGQKMSKSKGNVLNPQDIMSEYGSDALRMGLLVSRSPGISQAFSVGKVVAGRNFANKLWNIARFIEDKTDAESVDGRPQPFTDADHWLIRQLNNASKRIGELIETYRFAEAFELMYHTVWDDFADWYIESSKVTQNTSVLAYALQTILRFSHPFAPFVTETIWQTLKWEEGLLALSTWPTEQTFDADAAKRFEDLQSIVVEARTVATDLAQGKQTLLYRQDSLIDQNRELIAHLGHLKGVEQVSEAHGLRLAVAHHEAWLGIDEQTLEEHKGKLQVRLEDAKQQITKLQARLDNKSYVDNAPEAVVQQTRDQLADTQALTERLKRELTVI